MFNLFKRKLTKKEEKKEVFPERIIIPIGHDCHISMNLNLLELRKYSYPFDWIIPEADNELMETRFYLLLNNFERFFNQEDFEIIDNPYNIPHFSVFNKYTGFIFHHDFDRGLTFEEQFPKVKEKYTRRCNRMIDHIKNAKEIYFIYAQDTWDHIDYLKTTLNKYMLKTMLYKFNKYYPDKNVHFLIFQHDSNLGLMQYKEEFIDTGIKNYTVTRYLSNHTYTKDNEKLGLILSFEKILKDVHLL